MASKLSVIGNSEIRKDAAGKAQGIAQYTADLPLENTAIGTMVRSPYHHARILSVDLGNALRQPDVLAVLTAADVPGSKTFGLVPDQPALAVGEVRHIGEPVVLIVARNQPAAQKAAQLIRIDYEVLPAVLDPVAALSADAPGVHPGGNLLSQFNVDSGNLDDGFAAADVVLEETFSVQRQAPAYMEPENSLAEYHADGSLTVWVSSQEPYVDRVSIAAVLGIPIEKVRVRSSVVGGAFGGKEDSSIAILAALAAWKTHHNVRIVNNRRESFNAHPKRHPAQITLKIGAKKDGTLVALDGKVWTNTGAYASYGPAVGSLLTEMVTGPYHIPNVNIETKVVYTHSPYSGAMRGFGSPQAHFAIESAMDMLAKKLNMDPVELRRKNLLKQGDFLPTRVVLNETALGLAPILDRAAEARTRLQQIKAAPGRVSGVGLALAMQSMGLGAKITDTSTNRLEWLPDGRVLIHLGAPDLGQGLITVVEQITAEALGLPFDRIITAPLDTDDIPNGAATCASRMTYLVGNAMLSGAETLKKELIYYASNLLNVFVEEISYEKGMVRLPNGDQFPASEFASRAADQGAPLQVQANFTFPYPAGTTPQHLPIGMPHVKYVFAAQVVRVEIDPELGTVEVTDVEAIHDLGRVINRSTAEGQIEGGVVMGLGYALMEDMSLKNNGKWVDSFTEYLLPTSKDIPAHINIQMLEYPEYDGPYGAKGLAEICLVPTAPAVANAVDNALGVRVQHLPITPEKLTAVE
jgi:xanthine dehydrogenase molybdenum-binding subunit